MQIFKNLPTVGGGAPCWKILATPEFMCDIKLLQVSTYLSLKDLYFVFKVL